MSGEGDELAARLALLEASTGKRQEPRRPPLLPLMIGGLALLGGGAALWSLRDEAGAAPALQTAAAEEFQTGASGFGDIAPLPVVLPARPAPVPEIPGPSAAEAELRASVSALQAELKDLRSRSAPESLPETEADLKALNLRLAEMEAAARETQEALERQLTGRDRELERLRMDLEIARLGGSPAAPVSGSAGLEDRIRSPLIAFGGSGGSVRETGSDGQRPHGDEAFVREGAQAAPVSRAAVIVNPRQSVLQGTVIQAVLETAMDSSLAGVLRARVSEDVHAADGSKVLIPRGAQLLGRYRPEARVAQSRVTVAWDRILLPDHQSVSLSAYGGDALGRSGLAGDLDSRFGTRFGSAALISLIGALPDLARSEVESPRGADLAADMAGDLRDAGRGAMQDYLSLPPVIRVPQGARITVMVDRDLEIL